MTMACFLTGLLLGALVVPFVAGIALTVFVICKKLQLLPPIGGRQTASIKH